MYCTRLAGNTGRKKSPKNRPLGTIAQICQAISSQLRHISTIGKNLLSSNISSTSSHNMVNFSPLAAEIGPVVWGTPANFNGHRVLIGSLTARHSSIRRQPNFAASNRGRHLYSAGRPSRWALAHILVVHLLCATWPHRCVVTDVATINRYSWTWYTRRILSLSLSSCPQQTKIYCYF